MADTSQPSVPRWLSRWAAIGWRLLILSISAGTAIAGIPGAFLAVPTTSILIVVYNHFHRPSQVEPLEDEGGLAEAEAEGDGSAPQSSSPPSQPRARSRRRPA